jgi:uncharacterized surface protein with fasciclin (FAS1) repeats
MSLVRLLSAVAMTALLAGSAAAQPAPAAPAPAVAPPVVSSVDVLETLKGKGNFTIFLKLMDSAQLTGPIKGLPSVTIFAPTDAAFATLSPGIIDNWMKPENVKSLQKLMLYHIVNTPIASSQVIDHKGEAPTGSGGPVTLDGTNGGFKVNDATATLPETKATNGYVYVIDKVLAPR